MHPSLRSVPMMVTPTKSGERTVAGFSPIVEPLPDCEGYTPEERVAIVVDFTWRKTTYIAQRCNLSGEQTLHILRRMIQRGEAESTPDSSRRRTFLYRRTVRSLAQVA